MSRVDDGLTTKALAYLETCPEIWAERRNSGKVPTRGGWVHLGEDGTPDITGYIKRAGRYALPFGIETKAPKGELNENQIAFQKKAAVWGIPVFNCKTMADVINAVRALREM